MSALYKRQTVRHFSASLHGSNHGREVMGRHLALPNALKKLSIKQTGDFSAAKLMLTQSEVLTNESDCGDKPVVKRDRPIGKAVVGSALEEVSVPKKLEKDHCGQVQVSS
jgi:hypothetical protein